MCNVFGLSHHKDITSKSEPNDGLRPYYSRRVNLCLSAQRQVEAPYKYISYLSLLSTLWVSSQCWASIPKSRRFDVPKKLLDKNAQQHQSSKQSWKLRCFLGDFGFAWSTRGEEQFFRVLRLLAKGMLPQRIPAGIYIYIYILTVPVGL